MESAGNGGDGERAEAGHFLDDGSDNHVRGGSVVPGIDLSVSETEAPKSSAPPPSAVAPSATSTSGGSVKIAAAAAAKARKIEQENDDEYLDTIISELATAAAAAGAAPHELETGVSSPLARLLRCDVRCLKLDYELRRKFGAGVGGGGDRGDGAAAAAGAARARRARRGMMMALRVGNVTASALALKRLVVSSPKEDWPKPPSLVGGGLGMKRSEAPAYLPRWQLEAHRGADWFMFERSGSLEQLQVTGGATINTLFLRQLEQCMILKSCVDAVVLLLVCNSLRSLKRCTYRVSLWLIRTGQSFPWELDGLLIGVVA